MVEILSLQTVDVDFALGEGSCFDDCTDWQGNCNSGCEGIGNCTFVDNSCFNRPKDFVFSKIVDGDINEITCCEGPVRVYPVVKPVITSSADHLYDYTFHTSIGGKKSQIHLLVFRSENK